MAALTDFKKVLITDKIDPICKHVLEENGIDVKLQPGLAKEDLLKEIKVRAYLLICSRRMY